jgi:predicted alpha/beta hydrolase family esterase
MFFDVGRKGHINALSNLGEWEEGRALLKEFEKIL